jgi:hypothetical protein
MEKTKGQAMKQSNFPAGWDEQRVRRVLAHYETQSEEEAVAEDQAAYEGSDQAMVEVPRELIPAVRYLIAKRRAQPLAVWRGRAKRDVAVEHRAPTRAPLQSAVELKFNNRLQRTVRYAARR